MLDFTHTPSLNSNSDIRTFTGKSVVAGAQWETWVKPRGKSMLNIVLLGKGGNGGTGAVNIVSTAAGGGGGGSGAQTVLTIPLALLPDILYLSLAGDSNTTTLASYIAIAPNTIANNTLAYAAGGGNGGNAVSLTAGAAGAGGAVATAALMPLGFGFTKILLAGQAGTIGGTTGAGAALTLPVTGLRVTGGTGGAGLGAAALAGTAGGSFTVAGIFTEHPQAGGAGGSATTTPPGIGATGRIINPLGYFYGGTGGGSTHGGATGAGAVQACGGNGAYGCGAGGMGGALTGSTAAVAAKGGAALAILTCW